MMQRFLATICAVVSTTGAAQACDAVAFDYSSFSRPPQKLDLNRYLAGQEDTDYLSVALNGITLQISPANWEMASDLAGIWEAWAAQGQTHEMFGQFHDYFEQPQRMQTPFGDGLTGYLSEIKPEYRPKELPAQINTILFVFAQNAQGGGIASLYLNDPTGEGDLQAIMAELASFTTIDPACTSDSGAYEGRYIPDRARYIVFPVEAFSDSD